jgi:hypothetical protein
MICEQVLEIMIQCRNCQQNLIWSCHIGCSKTIYPNEVPLLWQNPNCAHQYPCAIDVYGVHKFVDIIISSYLILSTANEQHRDGEIYLLFDFPQVTRKSRDYWQSYKHLKFSEVCLEDYFRQFLTSRISIKQSWKIPDFSAAFLCHGG